MKRWALLLSLAATGCATGPTLEQRMLPFIGRSEGDIVAALGVPARTYQADDRTFLTFEERRSTIMAGDPFLTRGYSRYGPYFAPSTYVTRWCDITFTLRGGRAESFSLRGDGCR